MMSVGVFINKHKHKQNVKEKEMTFKKTSI